MPASRHRHLRRRGAALVIACSAVLCAGACSEEQDPGFDQRVEVPDDTRSAPSNTLGPCPEGGPDATTPEAGCLDAAGDVVRP